jgi:hypothetical protein
MAASAAALHRYGWSPSESAQSLQLPHHFVAVVSAAPSIRDTERLRCALCRRHGETFHAVVYC